VEKKIKETIVFGMIALLATGILSVEGCLEKAEFFKDVSPREAFSIIQGNKKDLNFVILDVRTPEEFGDGHIENAVSIDFRGANFRESLSRLDKNKVYFVYCKGGVRSGKALEVMKESGFKRVYHLPAGVTGWKEKGLPLKK
jgi:rhodanese-related sulfurtransferase